MYPSIAGLIEAIYDSVDAGHGWMPVLEVLDDTFNAVGAHLFVRDPDTGCFLENGYSGPIDDDMMAKFERMIPSDPSVPLGLANPNTIINEIDH